MPKRDQLLKDLSGEHDVGVLLVAQMGGVPEEIQLIIQTATYDESVGGLREKTAYIVRGLGVKEHRFTLGVFGALFFADDHPVLAHHNHATYRIDFTGTPADPNALVLDIQAAHSYEFGPWRDLAEDINRAQPLYELVQQGSGTLGEMPEQAAQRMTKVLAHHNMDSTLTQTDDARTPDPDEHGRTRRLKLLGLDDAYLIAYDFTVDIMGNPK